jgi:hypothetical protein
MIYEGRVGPKDAELLKLSKYYVAHVWMVIVRDVI